LTALSLQGGPDEPTCLGATPSGQSQLGRARELVPANLTDWLASIDRDDPALLDFAQRLDNACREAERVSGQELPERLAAAVLLRVVAEGA
jgi:hypothetical protein